MIDRLETLLKIPEQPPELANLQRKRLKMFYWLSGFGILFLIFLVPEPVRNQPVLFWKAIVFYLVWSMACAVGLLILRGRRLWVSAFWGALALYGYLSYAMYFIDGDPDNLLHPYFLLILVLVALFISRRAVIFFAALVGATNVILVFVHESGWVRVLFSPEAVFFNHLGWTLFFIVFTVLMLVYISSVEERQVLIRRSEARFRLLFDVSPVALWEVDASLAVQMLRRRQSEGVVDLAAYVQAQPDVAASLLDLLRAQNVNQTAVSLFQAPDKTALLHNFRRILTPDSHRVLLESLVAMANGRVAVEQETNYDTLTGERLQAIYRWSVTPGHEQSFAQVIFTLTNITAQKKAEGVLQRYTERMNFVHQIDVAILAAQSIPEIAQAVLARLQNLIPYTEAVVVLFDMPAQKVSYIAGQNYLVDPNRKFPIAAWDTIDLLAQGQVFHASDLQGAAQLSPLLQNIRNQGGRSLFVVPLHAPQELLGAIGLISAEPGAFTPEHIEIVEQIAMPVAIAIQNTNLFEAERMALQQAETLRQVANILNASLDQEQLLQAILEQLAQVIPFDNASINLVVDEMMRVVAYQDFNPDVAGLITEHIPKFVNMSQVLETKRPYIIQDTLADPNWLFLPGSELTRCWLGVPMLVRDKTLGLLALDKHEADFYTNSHAQLALAFANQAAIAIENANLYRKQLEYAEKLERRVKERLRDLSTVYDITALTSEDSEIEPVMASALETVIHSLGCLFGSLYVTNDQETFYLLHEIGVPDFVRPYVQQVSIDDDLVQAFTHPGAPPFIIKDIAETSYGQKFQVPKGEFVAAVVQMRSKGKLMGVLTASHNAGRQFSAEDLALLGSIADHIAVTIENGRLHRNDRQLAVMQERERMARELHDSITQSLYAISLFSEAARDSFQINKTDKVGVYLDQIVSTTVQAMKEMRLMVYDLRATTLLEEGLVHALRYRLENVEARAGIAIHFNAPEHLALPAEVEESLYRISQEALNNTLKHAKATRIEVQIDAQDNQIRMMIADNGRGFHVPQWQEHPTGHGLPAIQKYVAQFSGDFELISQPDKGTTVTVHLDLTAATIATRENYAKRN